MKLKNRKTGEIFHGNNIDLYTNKVYLEIIDKDGYPKNYDYNSLAELREEWGDYVPKEPLIKDEKIRKAVRAWAEANELDEVYLSSNGYEIYGGIDDTVMQFTSEPFPFADEKETFTIAELCGEEEETYDGWGEEDD